jgi:hypothetical protein
MPIQQLFSGGSLRARLVQGACLFVVGSAINLAVIGDRSIFASGVVAGMAIFLAFNLSFGAVAGAVYYFTGRWRQRGGWRQTIANVSSVLVPAVLFFILLGVASRSG